MMFAKLDSMIRGWFVGSFQPTLFDTDSCEVAVKHYQRGDSEESHLHKLATEVTAIIAGTVRMAGRTLTAGDIVRLEPGEVTDFLALTDATTVVVKVPGAKNDKYLVVSPPNSE